MRGRRWAWALVLASLLILQIAFYSIPTRSVYGSSHGLPELYVDSVGIDRSDPQPGQTAGFTASVKNDGDGDTDNHASQVDITFFVDGTQMKVEYVTHVQDHSGKSVGPTQRVWTITSGVHTVTACVDYQSRVPETNEGNNCKSVQIGSSAPAEKISTMLDISVCLSNGDCFSNSVAANTNVQVTIQGMLKTSNTQEGISGRTVQLSWPGGSTTVTTSSSGMYSYTTSVYLSPSSYTFSASFAGDDLYKVTSNSVTVTAQGIATQPSPPSLISYRISPTTVNAGETFRGFYTISNPASTTVSVGLGLSIRKSGTYGEIVDTSNDITVIVSPGTSEYARSFRVPSSASGTYDVAIAIWSGQPGSSTQLQSTGWISNMLTVGTSTVSTPSPEPFKFSLSSSTYSLSITAGNYGYAKITVRLESGAAQSVSLSCSGLPTQVRCEISPSIVTPTGYADLTIITGTTSPSGSWTVTVGGTGGGQTRSTSISVTINPPTGVVQPPSISEYTVTLTSSADDGRTNIGSIKFDGSTYILPRNIVKKVVSSYSYSATVNVPDGYYFSYWQASGGISVSNRDTQTTGVRVSGIGTLKAEFVSKGTTTVQPEPTPQPTPEQKDKPDLTIAGIFLSPNLPRAGDQVKLSAHIRNLGFMDADDVFDRMSIDGTEIRSTRSFYVPAESMTISKYEWKASAGTHTITWEVDPDYRISESNENNNSFTKTIFIESGPGPSVQPSSIFLKLDKTQINLDGSVIISGLLSPPLAAKIKLSLRGPDNRGFVETTNSNSNGDFSLSFKPSLKGTWSVFASWEGNTNYKSTASSLATFKVSASVVQETVKAVIIDIKISKNSFKPEERFTSSIKIKNTGNTQGTFYLGLTIQDPAGKSYDIKPKRIKLDPGEQTSKRMSWDIPETIAEGSYTVFCALWKSEPNPSKPQDPLDRRTLKDAFRITKEETGTPVSKSTPPKDESKSSGAELRIIDTKNRNYLASGSHKGWIETTTARSGDKVSVFVEVSLPDPYYVNDATGGALILFAYDDAIGAYPRGSEPKVQLYNEYETNPAKRWFDTPNSKTGDVLWAQGLFAMLGDFVSLAIPTWIPWGLADVLPERQRGSPPTVFNDDNTYDVKEVPIFYDVPVSKKITKVKVEMPIQFNSKGTHTVHYWVNLVVNKDPKGSLSSLQAYTDGYGQIQVNVN